MSVPFSIFPNRNKMKGYGQSLLVADFASRALANAVR